MKWTEEQEKAINLKDCNLLVSAGAGSGKTAVLVERIISMVINDKIDITNILVVTFTNASATEMKERILNKLYEKLEENIDNVWLQQQISNINKANIMTIHAFCLKVIREYYYMIGIDPSFSVISDIDNTLMKYEVLEEIIEEKYEQEKPDLMFVELLNIFDSKKEEESLQSYILKLYTFLQNMPFPEDYEKDMLEKLDMSKVTDFSETIWGQAYIQMLQHQADGIIETYEKIIEFLSEDEKQVTFYTNSMNMIKELNDLIKQNISWNDIVEKVQTLKLDRRIPLKGYDEDTTNIVKNCWESIKKNIAQMQEMKYTENIVKENSVNYMTIQYLFKLVDEFSIAFTERKNNNKLIDFNDFEHYALNILLHKDEDGRYIASDVAKIYRNKFKEILIDEYQDTNDIQEYILNLVSTVEDGKPNIFMVGDIKQSIYKFRGARPEIFINKYETYSKDNSKYMKVNLYKNFRSRPEVLDFVNYVFSKIMKKDNGNIDYTKDEYLNVGAEFIGQANDMNKTEIDILNLSKIDNEENIENESDEYPEEDEVKKENVALEAQMIVNRINELINSGFKVTDKKTGELRQVKYKDIVILMRTTKGTADIVGQVFKQNNVPMFIDNTAGYLDEIETQEVLSFLQVIDNPYQDIPLITVLKSPFGNFTDNELVEIRMVDKYSSFYVAMQKASITNAKVKTLLDKIVEYREMARYVTVSKLIWKIYEDFSYIEYMRIYKNYEQKKSNLMLLFDRAEKYENSSYKGLFNFINFINKIKMNNQDLGSATILSEEDDVVRLMSIHKSKGLEFPVVFLSNTDRKMNFMDLNKKILLHQELLFGNEIYDLEKHIHYPSMQKEIIRNKMKNEIIAEEIRMLYVALTRAKEKLIITGVSSNIDLDEQKGQFESFENLVSYKQYMYYCLFSNKAKYDRVNLRYYQVKDLVQNSIEEEEFNRLKEQCKQNVSNVENTSVEDISLEFVNEEVHLKLPHKVSVSEIKRNYQMIDQEETAQMYNEENIQMLKKNDDKEISALNRGTMYHYIFQQLDFKRNYILEEVEEYIKKLNKYSNEELEAIDCKLIYNYTQSAMFNRIGQAEKIYKEQPFTFELASEEISKLYSISTSDTLLLQGIVDLFFIENNEIVILDYKTDKTNNEEVIKERYSVQLEYYAKALQKLLKKNVKEKYVYLVNSGRLIEM